MRTLNYSCTVYENVTMMYSALYRSIFLPHKDGFYTLNVSETVQRENVALLLNKSYTSCDHFCLRTTPILPTVWLCDDYQHFDTKWMEEIQLPNQLNVEINDGYVSFDLSVPEPAMNEAAVKILWYLLYAGAGLLALGLTIGLIIFFKNKCTHS